MRGFIVFIQLGDMLRKFITDRTNAPKANAVYIGVHCDAHISNILNSKIFISILWERA